MLTVQVTRTATGSIVLDVQPRADQALSGPDLIAVGHALAGLLARMGSQ